MIPARFQLGGSTWRVEMTPGLVEMGHCDAEVSTIRVRAGMSKQTTAATFFHELVHAILYTMGEQQHDERVVDGMAHLLHQFSVTAETRKKRG